MKRPAIYIVASERNGTLYVGVTSDLVTRVAQHRAGAVPGFATRYGCKLLVYFELYEDMPTAILREKQIKAGSRAKSEATRQSRVTRTVRAALDRHAAMRLAMTLT